MLPDAACDPIETCERCPVYAFATANAEAWSWPHGNVRVAWRGAPTWEPGRTVALIGMNPGKQEFLDREYFCGAAGKGLTTIIESTGQFKRRDMYVSNTYKCATPGQKELDEALRGADNDTTSACLQHHLVGELAVVKPRGIVLFGEPTYRAWQRATALLVTPDAWRKSYADARFVDANGDDFAVRLTADAAPTPVLISAHPSFGNLAREENKSRFLAFLKRTSA